MKRSGEIYYPPFIEESARVIGCLRHATSIDLDKKNPRYDRGDDSARVHILGVKGEMIFSYFLQAQNINHRINKVLSGLPGTDWDILIKGKRIDVKSIKSGSNQLTVNKEAHKKKNSIDYYAFVQVVNDVSANYWIVNYNEVNNWEVKKLKYSEAYCLEIKRLQIAS